MKEAITKEEFSALAKELVGLTVSRPWRGYGTAIFLELGMLHRKPILNPKRELKGHSLKGEATIEWSWRVEGPRTVRFGSWSGERKITNGVARLEGRKVLTVSVEGRLPEIVIGLSGNLWAQSFTTIEGQPRWVVFLHDGSYIYVERGSLQRQKSRFG